MHSFFTQKMLNEIQFKTTNLSRNPFLNNHFPIPRFNKIPNNYQKGNAPWNEWWEVKGILMVSHHYRLQIARSKNENRVPIPLDPSSKWNYITNEMQRSVSGLFAFYKGRTQPRLPTPLQMKLDISQIDRPTWVFVDLISKLIRRDGLVIDSCLRALAFY